MKTHYGFYVVVELLHIVLGWVVTCELNWVSSPPKPTTIGSIQTFGLYGNNFGPLCLLLKRNSLMIMQNYAVQNGEVMISF
jgi:hypothetical protein